MTFTLGFGENIFEYTSSDTFNATLFLAVFDLELFMIIDYLPQHLKTRFAREEGYFFISITDPKTQFICTLDDKGRLQKVTRSGREVSTVPFQENLDLKTLPRGTMVTADVDTPMRAAVEINFVVGLPLPVIDRIGKLIGIVGNKEILSTILGDTNRTRSMM